MGAESPPTVFNYVDFKNFLKDFYEFQKKQDPHFSFGQFAHRAKIKTRNYLKRVIDGERPLSNENLPKFCVALKLNAKESQYFEALVQYNQAKESIVKNHYYEQLKYAAAGVKGSQFEIDQNHYEVFENWYTIPIYELLTIQNMSGKPKKITEALKGLVTLKQVKQSLKVLEKAGMVEFDEPTKSYKKATAQIVYSKDVVNLAVQNFHKAMLKLSLDLIDKEQEIDKRYLRALSLVVPSETAPEVRKKLDQFIKKLNGTYSSKGQAEGVLLQINAQVLQLTNELKSTNKQR